MNTTPSSQTEKSVGLNGNYSLNGNPKSAEKGMTGIVDSFHDQYEGAQAQVKKATESTLSFFKEYPIITAAGVAVVGVVVGWMMHSARKSSN